MGITARPLPPSSLSTHRTHSSPTAFWKWGSLLGVPPEAGENGLCGAAHRGVPTACPWLAQSPWDFSPFWGDTLSPLGVISTLPLLGVEARGQAWRGWRGGAGVAGLAAGWRPGAGSEGPPAPPRALGARGQRAAELLEGPTQRWALGTGGQMRPLTLPRLAVAPLSAGGFSAEPAVGRQGSPERAAPSPMTHGHGPPASQSHHAALRAGACHTTDSVGWHLGPESFREGARPWRLTPANSFLWVSSHQGRTCTAKAWAHEPRSGHQEGACWGWGSVWAASVPEPHCRSGVTGQGRSTAPQVTPGRARLPAGSAPWGLPGAINVFVSQQREGQPAVQAQCPGHTGGLALTSPARAHQKPQHGRPHPRGLDQCACHHTHCHHTVTTAQLPGANRSAALAARSGLCCPWLEDRELRRLAGCLWHLLPLSV